RLRWAPRPSPDGCAGRLARAPPENATDTWDGIRRLTAQGRRRIAVLARRPTALGSTSVARSMCRPVPRAPHRQRGTWEAMRRLTARGRRRKAMLSTDLGSASAARSIYWSYDVRRARSRWRDGV